MYGRPRSKPLNADGTRSKFESVVWQAVKAQDPNALYEKLKLKYTLEKTYTPDFYLGNGILVEAKGYFTASDRTKMLRVREMNPDFEIRFVFQNAKVKLNKGSTTTYGEWATKNNFKWAEKLVPSEWVLEDGYAYLGDRQ